MLGVITSVRGSAGDVHDDAAAPLTEVVERMPAEISRCGQVHSEVRGRSRLPLPLVLDRTADPHLVRGDFLQPNAALSVWRAALDATGHVDVLFNNAGCGAAHAPWPLRCPVTRR
ncbi:hypothetical protein [Modestobacter sp. I12A-02662]|uniref:hypothetical protein n=1 Tax=Modestobacter sp. I12A-02662 TaxID=1730496 RepID=UPI0034E02149